MSDGKVRALTPYGRFGFHPDWSSTGNLIAFDTYDLLAFGGPAPGASNLFTIRPDGSHLRQLTFFKPGGNRVSAVTFTPDAKRIMFTYQVGMRRKAGIMASVGGANRADRLQRSHHTPEAFTAEIEIGTAKGIFASGPPDRRNGRRRESDRAPARAAGG